MILNRHDRVSQAAAYFRKLAEQLESGDHFVADINLSQTVESLKSGFNPDRTEFSVSFDVVVIDNESTPSLTGIFHEVSHG